MECYSSRQCPFQDMSNPKDDYENNCFCSLQLPGKTTLFRTKHVTPFCCVKRHLSTFRLYSFGLNSKDRKSARRQFSSPFDSKTVSCPKRHQKGNRRITRIPIYIYKGASISYIHTYVYVYNMYIYIYICACIYICPSQNGKKPLKYC